MKDYTFISKNANLRVVITPGTPAEPLTGRTAVSGVYAKFENGILKVKDEKMAEALQKHPGFKMDFILSEDEDAKDPYIRKGVEPEHDITEIKYGHVGKSLNPKSAIKITPETKRALENMATKMAEEKVVKILAKILEKGNDQEKTDETNKEQTQETPPKAKSPSGTAKMAQPKKATVKEVATPEDKK